MSKFRRRKFQNAIAALPRQALSPPTILPKSIRSRAPSQPTHRNRRRTLFSRPPLPDSVSTGFESLDQITGCSGIPQGHITLLSGQTTSGKLTLAFKILANAQQININKGAARLVALVDLNQTADPDYLSRCQIDLDRLIVAYPLPKLDTVQLLFDLAETSEIGVIVVDGISNLQQVRGAMPLLNNHSSQLAQALHISKSTMIFVNEAKPSGNKLSLPRLVRQTLRLGLSPELHLAAGLHIMLHRERWLYQSGQLIGYQAVANIKKSRWHAPKRRTSIAIEFNGTVKAAPTW